MINYIEDLGKKLNLTTYPNEDVIQYKCRVTYTLLGEWVKMFCFGSNGEYETKISIHYKSSQIIDSLCKTDNSMEQYFSPEGKKAINLIRDTLLRSGDLFEIGVPPKISIISKSNMVFNDCLVFHRGYLDNPTNQCYSGLCSFETNNHSIVNTELFAAFNIPDIGFKKFYSTCIQNKKYIELYNVEGLEYFNPLSKKVLSSSWSDKEIFGFDGISVAREKLSIGTYKYHIIKKVNDTSFICDFSEYEQNSEIRDTVRLLYAFKAMNGKPASAVYNSKQNYTIWRFWSQLPPSEIFLLRYIGWPVDTIDNKYTFIVKNELNPVIYYMLDNIGIERSSVDGEI